MDNILPTKAQVLAIARENGGFMSFMGTRPARGGGEEHRYVCLNCGRTDHFREHPVAIGNAPCPDCEPGEAA